MARIPILQDPAQLQTGNRTLRTPDLPAVTNAGIAKGLADVGAVAMDISEKAKRANDVTNLTNASIEMQKAQLEFATFQQETPDETKWLPKWKEINSRLEGQFSQMPMTPDARAQLQNRLTTWSTNGTIQVQASAFKQTGQRMASTVELAKKQAIDTGDIDLARQALDAEVAAGFKTKEQSDVEFYDVQEAGKAKQIQSMKAQRAEAVRVNDWSQVADLNEKIFELGGMDKENFDIASRQALEGQLESDILGMVNGADGKPVNIADAHKMVDQYSILPQETKERLHKQIDDYKKEYANQDILKAMDDLVTGKLTTGAQFESQYLSPSQLAEARASIDKAIPPTPEQETEMYLGTMKAISDLDPEMVKRQDPQESLEFVKVAAAINRSPAHIRNRLADALTAQLSGNQDLSANGVAMRVARETMSDILQSKKASYFTVDRNGKQTLIKGKEADWIKEQARIMRMENEFERRMRGIENPTDKQFQDALQAVFGLDMNAARIDAYQPQPQSGFDVGPVRRREGIDASLFPAFSYPQ